MSEQEQETQDQNAAVEDGQQHEQNVEGQESGEQNPTETVEFWKRKAREQEKRAKSNADAADKLKQLEDEQKSEIQKATDRASEAEAEAAKVPTKVAEQLRGYLVQQNGISDEDAELFLTSDDPDTLQRQVNRLVENQKPASVNAHVPDASRQPDKPPTLDEQIATHTAEGNHEAVKRAKAQKLFS